MSDIEKLRNIGPKSARMLKEVGIAEIGDLRKAGCVNTFQRLRFLYPDQVSLNFLWAMHAGLQGRDWRDLSQEEKDSLKEELAARDKPA